MGNKVTNDKNNQDERKDYTKAQVIPSEIKELLADLAEIRNTILVGSPALLPKLAPALENAEARIQAMW